AEEEKGYYYGFANEGLWPLCHIVHERPQFRPDDWEYYRAVNAKFAQALVQEMDGVEAPVVLVQDYHFALLPHMIKRLRPDARIGIDEMLVGLGVERVDYTKGLPERMRAIRRFFERWPEYRGRAIFLQVASPSRSSIPRYKALQDEIQVLVREINDAIGERGWRPIVYRDRHHDRA